MKKKKNGIAAAMLICIGMMSGCGNGSSEKISETVSSTSAEVTTETSESVTTTITEATTATEITADEEYISQASLAYMPSIGDISFPEAENLSGSSLKLYEWRYDGDIICEEESSFAGGAEVISAAKSAAKEYLAELCGTAKEYEGYMGKRIQFNFHYLTDQNLEWYYSPSEEMLNGTAELDFQQGVYDDFDGDGKKESFLLFGCTHPMGESIHFGIFVGSDGKAEALPDSVCILDVALCPVRYNGFTHIIISGGYNNLTHHAEFYAVENGSAVHKHSEFAPPKPYKGAFMQARMAQASGDWLIFWNEEKNDYCTVLGDELTDEQAEDLFRSYGFYREDDKYSGRLPQYPDAESLRRHARMVGNICYIKHNEYDYEMFHGGDGSFGISSETRLIDADERYPRTFVCGVDVEHAAETMIRLKYDDAKREKEAGMTEYTGKFYEWRYDEDIVADRESFGGGEDIIKAAAEEVKKAKLGGFGADDYITFEQAAEIAESAVFDEQRERYAFIADGETEYYDKERFEYYLPDGRLEPIFQEGVYEDFDGDGKKESFMIFTVFNPANSFDHRTAFLVYTDSEGNVSIPEDGCGVCGGLLRPIRYNGFIHMCVEFGMSIGTHHAEFYAVKNGAAERIHSEFMPGSNYGGIFMEVSRAQAPGSWFIFWNEEEGRYSAVGSESLTREEAEAIWNSEEFQGVDHDVTLTEVYKTPEELQKGGDIVGKRYIMVFPPYTFEYMNGRFIRCESHMGVTGVIVDMDRAVNGNVVRLNDN